MKKMKKIIASIMLLVALTIASCGQKQKEINTANCKGHERNCPISEDCPEHPECEAHEKCEPGVDCKKHPSCVSYEKEKVN